MAKKLTSETTEIVIEETTQDFSISQTGY